MAKISGQSGVSLADTYAVPGGKIRLPDLDDSEVKVVHDMASTIFAERFRTRILTATSGAIAQNASWGITVGEDEGLPINTGRLLGVIVFANTAARTTRATVVVMDSDTGIEVPFFFWDTASDIETAARFSSSAGLAVNRVLQPTQTYQGLPLPTFVGGRLQPQGVVRSIVFRGTASAFGAGTVEVKASMLIADAQVASLPSLGLPIPSW